MVRKNIKKSEIKYPEIAIFALTKGSQINHRTRKWKSYDFMLNMIETQMRKSNVVSSKVGISGYKEDVAAYLAALLEIYFYIDIDIDLIDDINEYDPDIVPNKFY